MVSDLTKQLQTESSTTCCSTEDIGKYIIGLAEKVAVGDLVEEKIEVQIVDIVVGIQLTAACEFITQNMDGVNVFREDKRKHGKHTLISIRKE